MRTFKTLLIGIGVAALFIGFGMLAAAPARPQGYSAMFEAVDWLAAKYGVVAYTNHAELDPATYAQTYGDVITFNTLYVNDPDLLRASMTSDVISGYHTGIHCSPEQALAAHEFAHVLDYLTGFTANEELLYAVQTGQLSGTVSGYSLESTHEALAEAFTAVECDVPTEAEYTIYNMLVT